VSTPYWRVRHSYAVDESGMCRHLGCYWFDDTAAHARNLAFDQGAVRIRECFLDENVPDEVWERP